MHRCAAVWPGVSMEGMTRLEGVRDIATSMHTFQIACLQCTQ